MLAVNQPMPLPALPSITTRVATMDDLPFVDALQKKHGKQLGFFPRAQLEGYVRNGWMRIAEDAGVPVGYVAFRDRYLKRDELGAVFQLCVEPGRQRGLIGASLLQSAFDASAYGCRLFCCWCAQDLAANRFWESMGFQALAFRGGSTKKSRVHLFWQKRIRAGDDVTPFWFPAKTDGGALREDRIVLPIPRGMRWDEAMPVLVGTEEKKVRAKRKTKVVEPIAPPVVKTKVRFGAPGAAMAIAPVPEPVVETLPAVIEKTPRAKVDPKLVAAARELRDRWMDELNAGEVATLGKYDVARQIAEPVTVRAVESKLLAA